MISFFKRKKSPKARHPNPIKQALFQTAGAACTLLLLASCSSSGQTPITHRVEVKLLVGSALAEFCTQAAQQFNQQNSKLENGKVVQGRNFPQILGYYKEGDVATISQVMADLQMEFSLVGFLWRKNDSRS